MLSLSATVKLNVYRYKLTGSLPILAICFQPLRVCCYYFFKGILGRNE